MKKPEIWKLVLGRLLPARAEFSRDDWRSYIQRYLLPEIQTETLRFYGENTSAEALHPGIDYASLGHRARLQAFPRHAQLFAAFDDLKLTESEIHTLCKWEGTKLAKEHFERQHKAKVRDTTWDGMKPYNKQPPCGYLTRQDVVPRRDGSTQRKTEYEQASKSEGELDDELMEDSDDLDDLEESEQESDDEAQRSYGVELNQRLIDGRMDADWEQWMKEAIERGDVPGSLDLSHSQALQSFAQLHSQHRAQIMLGLGPTTASPGSSSSSNATDAQQSGVSAPTTVSNNDENGTQYLPSMSLRTGQSPGSYRPATQHVGTSTPGPRATSVSHQIINSVNDSFVQPPQAAAPATRSSPTYWGREIPEIFSDSPRPHIAALQAQLPPPPQYSQFYPAARVASASVNGPIETQPSMVPSATVPS